METRIEECDYPFRDFNESQLVILSEDKLHFYIHPTGEFVFIDGDYALVTKPMNN